MVGRLTSGKIVLNWKQRAFLSKTSVNVSLVRDEKRGNSWRQNRHPVTTNTCSKLPKWQSEIWQFWETVQPVKARKHGRKNDNDDDDEDESVVINLFNLYLYIGTLNLLEILSQCYWSRSFHFVRLTVFVYAYLSVVVYVVFVKFKPINHARLIQQKHLHCAEHAIVFLTYSENGHCKYYLNTARKTI